MDRGKNERSEFSFIYIFYIYLLYIFYGVAQKTPKTLQYQALSQF